MAKHKAKSAGVPSGFAVIGSSDGKAWQPEPGDAPLVGVVVGKKTIDAKKAGRKKAKKGDTVTIVSVAQDGTGEIFAVWESVGIADWCKAVKMKQRVFLRLDAVVKRGAKRFKKITAAIGK